MGDERSRRSVLRGGVAALGLATLSGRSVAATTDLSNSLRIESEGGGVAAYEFTVSGSIRQDDTGDQVSGNRAYGHVGPDRGTDSFSYSGEITGLVLTGPATAYRDGFRLYPGLYPAPDDCVTAAHFPHGGGTKRLRIESDGGGFAAYEFAASESLRQVDSGDHVSGTHAYGHVGPKRGTDEFEYAGNVTRFRLAGPATVSVDGAEVTPPQGGERAVFRANPKREITVTSETTVVFEALARGYRGQFASEAWYVDGELRYGPDIFYEQLTGGGRCAFTQSFESTGTHRVEAEIYDEGDSPDDGATPIGTTDWVVEVGSGGNRPPTVERVAPSAKTITASWDSPDRRTFEVSASDPDGRLDRVVWWLSQCDAVVDVSPVAGSSDTASVSFAPEVGCPFGAWAIDEHGAMSELAWWNVEES
ncbi:hypothetical protein [Halorussus amylolyticus]|uniref:hypothetical protein n=1 Tax=Halorussus amylolyticus TaxID=1126242 RepID=UPI00104A570B|nr:hypothetical protein [Halorussus amylolyticus]